jgi:hypothetical protein
MAVEVAATKYIEASHVKKSSKSRNSFWGESLTPDATKVCPAPKTTLNCRSSGNESK